LVVIPFLLVAPALEAIDGDVEDVQLGAPPTLEASQDEHGLLADTPGDPAPAALPERRPRTPTRPSPSWRPPVAYPVHCRPVMRASTDTRDATADPA
jgi:hypothetical protein